MIATNETVTLETVDLSTLPERTHVELELVDDFNRIYVDAYTISSTSEGNEITISAKGNLQLHGPNQDIFLINRVIVSNVLTVGHKVAFKRKISMRRSDKMVERHFYVASIQITRPVAPRTIDLYSLPTGSVVKLRSASMEMILFITGQERSRPAFRGDEARMWAFAATLPRVEEAAAYQIAIDRYVVEGQRFGRMTSILEAHVIEL